MDIATLKRFGWTLCFAFASVHSVAEDVVAADEHWAFQPMAQPSVPTVVHTEWPRSNIDYFILAALESHGLMPAPEADRLTLIRRLSFDLLGLPPTIEDVDRYLADTETGAYERLVERYLASPHYGERWARHWLDVARYADTKGYVYGREEKAFVHSHVYRDWVVSAMNADMPYDEFVRLQLAADTMTDENSREHLAAMGFLTLGQRYLGVQADIIDDRIDTVTRGLMALTVSCARCHDHKFDPVPIDDYYSMYGIFSASSERVLPLTPETHGEERYAAFNEEMAKREGNLRDTFATRSAELEVRLRSQVEQYLIAVPDAESLPTDDFYEILDADDLNPTIVRRWASFIEAQGMDDEIFGLWNRLAASSEAEYTAVVDSVANTNEAVVNGLRAQPLNTFDDVAKAYGRVFKAVNDQWLAAPEGATALDDLSGEAIRSVMFDEGSPIRVPDGAVVDLEWMFDEPVRVELAKLQAEIDRWLISADVVPLYSVILADKPEMKLPHVFLRGNPASHGAEVPRRFLALLSPEERPEYRESSGRREMAEAIVSPENPLTARVLVNRVWGWHFGSGLVSTPSDFGLRSAPPSHPELLDWLALRFIESGWSLKELHREIVTSSVYRQSSGVTEARASEIDPENRLLSRFNRQRHDFETLRDAVLHTSGQLDVTMGGRPLDLASAPYPKRRSIYGRVDRQFLPPVFRVFDFPSPDMHSPKRSDTTVPQQALYLMNNGFVQEQARAFAERTASSASDGERIDALYRHAFQRGATDAERERALAYIAAAKANTPPTPPKVEPSPWSYGYGRYDAAAESMASFTPLPHFTGTAWQGGSSWPDATLGWAQLTADGGHPGNDLDHAIVRRWTAPASGRVKIEGRIRHARTEGDGIAVRVLSSRHGLLGAWFVHNTEADTNFAGITVEAGDTVDFEVDIKGVLNSDEHLWAPTIHLIEEEATVASWDAKAQFSGPYVAPPMPLTPWEKLAQVLLSSNEFLFVD